MVLAYATKRNRKLGPSIEPDVDSISDMIQSVSCFGRKSQGCLTFGKVAQLIKWLYELSALYITWVSLLKLDSRKSKGRLLMK